MAQNQKQNQRFNDQNQASCIKSRTFSNSISNGRNSASLNRKIVKFPPQQVQQEINRLQWRKNTDFPVVKIVDYHILNPIHNRDLIFSLKKISIQIILEGTLFNLTEVRQIPLFKVLYLIKQVLVGTERLCSLYGNFQVNPTMIGIDGRGKCKVWHNSKLHLSNPEMPCIQQQMTIRSLVDAFWTITRKSPKSGRFYQQLYKCNSFCECLNLLNMFALQQKIRIPHHFLLSDKFSVPISFPRKFTHSQHQNQNNPQVLIEKKCRMSERKKNVAFPCRLLKQKENATQRATSTFQTQLSSGTTSCLNSSNLVKSQLTYIKKIDSLFTPNHHYLDVIESVFEGDTDSRFSDDFSECHLLDHTIPPKNTPLWRSSSFYEKLSPETGSSEDLGSQRGKEQLGMSNWNIRYSTVNEEYYSLTDLDLV